MVLGAAVDALSAMTREAAARPDPRRTFGARFRKFREPLVTSGPLVGRASAPGAGWRTSGTAVRRPGRRGTGLGRVPRPLPARRPAARAAAPAQPGRPARAPALADARAGRRAPPAAAAPTSSSSAPCPESAVRPGPRRPGGAARRRAGPGRRQPAGRPGGRRGPPGAGGTAPGARGGVAATAWSATPSSPTRCATSWSRGAARPAAASRASSCVGSDLATMTAHAWTHRAFTEGVNAWREWLRQLQERREVPARADLLAVARAWERRVGTDAGARRAGPRRRARDWPATARSLAAPAPLAGRGRRARPARRVGARPARAARRARDPADDPAATEGRGGGPRRSRRTTALVVPPEARDWLESAAERMRRGHQARWLRCPRRPGRPRPAVVRTAAGTGGRTVAAGDPRPRGPGAARRDVPMTGGLRDQEGHPPRRHPQDRDVVPPGRAVQEQARCSASTASSTPPTGSTRTSWPPST